MRDEIPKRWDGETDVVTIGSGIGGLSAAITAREFGADAMVLERSGFVGGVTAYSFGEVWIGDLFGGLEVHDAATGAPIGKAVHTDGSNFGANEVGPSCFVAGQFVMVSTLGITYYDATKVLK